MAGTLITAPTFPLLQRRLLADLGRAGQEQPLAPKWVVVPSATLANHLRVVLAATATQSALAGARVLNLPRFAERLSLNLTGRAAPAWHPTLDLLLFELIAGLPARSPLANLRVISGSALLLRPTFTDLAEGGFGIEDLDKVESLAEEPDLPPQAQETLRLYAAWVRRLETQRVDWAPLTLQLLPRGIEQAADEELARALGAEHGHSPRLFVYGFYEWIDVHLQWLAALAERINTTIYYPWQPAIAAAGEHDGHPTGVVGRDAVPGVRVAAAGKHEGHPAFSFAQSILDDLRGRIQPLAEPATEPATDEAGMFFLATFPDGTIGRQPAFLSWQHASGTRAEAISAAVRIRCWLDNPDSPLAPQDILVVAPLADEYADTIRDVFHAFAIPLRVSGVAAGPVPADEPLRILAHIWAEQAPAEWVLAFLRSCPDAPALRNVNLETFESKVRELGVWGGIAWRAAFARVDSAAADADENHRPPLRFEAAEKRLIEHILHFIPATGTLPPAQLSAPAALTALRHLAEHWLPDDTLLAPLINAVEAVVRSSPNLAIDLSQWTRLLAEQAGTRTQQDPASEAVHFVPLMRARGLTARAVVILGLAAGKLPRRIEDDPILSLGTSLKIAGIAAQIGHRLPVKTRVTDEMRLLFFLLNTTADRVHWIVPETDAEGKSLAPTPWVQRYLQRWATATTPPQRAVLPGSSVPTAVATDTPANCECFRVRIPRSPALQAAYLATIEPERGSFLPPALMLPGTVRPAATDHGSPLESFLLESAEKRGHDPAWSGCIGSAPRFKNNRLGVTRLEALARCPFRFYASAVARWDPLEPLSLSHALDALTRGTLLHRLLEGAVQPHLKRNPLGVIAHELLVDDARLLRQLAQRIPELAPDAGFGLAMLLPVFQQAALDELVQMAMRYFASVTDSTAIPQETEAGFERAVPIGAGLTVAGKIDRIDQVGPAIVVIDFKSGRCPADYRKRVKLGWQIQAALYPWLSGKPEAAFQYVFLGDSEPKAGDAKGAPAAEQLLGDLAPILAQGAFVPTSNEAMAELGLENVTPCQFCQWASACRRFDPDCAKGYATLFAGIAPARCAALQAAAPPPKTERP